MKRRLFTKLEKFITDKDIRTCILTGPPFVGKTYLATDLFRSYSTDYLYLDVRFDKNLNGFINSEKEKKQGKSINLSELLCAYFRINFETLKNIPIILDEPYSNNELMAALSEYGRTFTSEKSLRLFIINGCYSHKVTDIFKACPNMLHAELGAFSFDEFLMACDHEWYAEVMEGQFAKKKRLPEMLHNELSSLFDIYLSIGGMPSAILEYLNYEGPVNTDNINQNLRLLTGLRYEDKSLEKILLSVESSLNSTSSKYTYSSIHRGATAGQYGESINIFTDDGMLTRTDSFTDEVNPSVKSSFRLYSNIYSRDASQRFISYAAWRLHARHNEIFFYETAGRAYIDFLFRNENSDNIPVVIKHQGKSRDRALSSYLSNHNTKYSVVISENNLDFQNDILKIPFYCTHLL